MRIMKEKRINEIKGLVFVAIGLILLASLVSFTPFDLSFYTSSPNIPPKNLIRTFGAYLGGLFLFLFGWASYAVPLFIVWLGIRFPQTRNMRSGAYGRATEKAGSREPSRTRQRFHCST